MRDCADGAPFFLCHQKAGMLQQLSQRGIQTATVISSPKFQEGLPSSDRGWSTSFWALAQSHSHPGSAQKQGLQWDDTS